jgi:murein L,D-transpeptidase YcbB/YkuD
MDYMQKKQYTPCYSLITCLVVLFSQHVSAYADDILIPAAHFVASDTNEINNTGSSSSLPVIVESSSASAVNAVHSPVFLENDSSDMTLSNPDTVSSSVKNRIPSDVLQTDSATALAPLHDIRPGQSSPLIKLLQQQQNMTPTGRYDDELVQWVKSQQESANMTANGIIDQRTWFLIFEQPATWQKNTSDEAQKQWASIVEKQSNNATGQFVVVNIPDMTLRAYSWDNTTHQATQLFTSKIIVGKPNTQTPLHDFFIWGIKYNPTWTPTSNMLKKNVFKNGAVNTAWLKQHGIRAVDSQGHVVPFSELSAQSSVHYMQPAGNSNALGVLKFETTSTEDIYLHDTNEKYHFNDNVRTFSSGCVRVQEYMQLAQWVSGLDEDTINHKLDNKQTRIEKIPAKVPVYFAYSQAWSDDGKTVFSPDPYHKENDISYKK